MARWSQLFHFRIETRRLGLILFIRICQEQLESPGILQGCAGGIALGFKQIAE
jgi:hypothetical protein